MTLTYLASPGALALLKRMTITKSFSIGWIGSDASHDVPLISIVCRPCRK